MNATPSPCSAGAVRAESLDRAHQTLLRGTAFLDRHIAPRCDTDATLHAPYIANILIELDRFLNILVDEVADWIGAPVRLRQRNTVNKLRSLDVLTPANDDDPDHARLLAIGRSRAFMKHLGGRDATRAGDPPAPPLTLSSADMTAIGRLYSDTARDLHAAALALRPR